MENQLYDTFNRVHDYLRISLTDSCNFRCLYCMPEENISCLPHKLLMQANEIEHIAKTFTNLGIKKIRLTGGEPLVRYDFKNIIEKIAKLPIEICITTNGVLLDKYWNILIKNNVKALNISLDTLNPEKFKMLTQRDSFHKVWNHILHSISEGFKIKLNVVVMKGINDNEILDFIKLTEFYPIEVRFIEFMPFNNNLWNNSKVTTTKDMLTYIKESIEFEKINDKENDTTKHYQVKYYTGTFGFISTMSQPFCNNCNRMRLTADGKMKNCLFGKEEFDILTSLRKGEDIIPIIKKCILAKAEKTGGQLNKSYKTLNPDILKNRSMIKIGG